MQVGSQTLSTNVYENDRDGQLSEVQYGNGGKVHYSYDDLDRLTGVRYDAETGDRYVYRYGANGAAADVEDNHLGRIARTDYDQTDRPCQSELKETATSKILYRTLLKYDKFSNLEQFTEKTGDEVHTSKYAYDRDNRVTEIQYDGAAQKVAYTYDDLGRVTARTAECGNTAGKLTSTYTYVDGAYGTNSTTPLVKKITQNGISFEYTYDSRGNIISEKRGNLTTTYAYDALGQLIRVNDPHENATWVYNYDRGGNITSKVKYAYTTGTLGTAVETIPYAYGDANWKDKLTAYNGTAITYDAIGNPLNDGSWTYEWAVGRQLKKMSRDGQSLTFKYDHNGMRIQKVLEHSWYPETTNYTYHGKPLTHMEVAYTDFDEVGHVDKLHFFYDAQSRPAKVRFNGTIYTYVQNLQGNIVGVLDSTGALVVEYKYDAWGKPLATTGSLADTLGIRNPFRYRGYVYDEESELYYLRSRFYNSAIGQFVNADTLLGNTRCLLSHNVFTYTKCRPTMRTDIGGGKEVIYSSYDSFVVEKDNFFHNFLYNTQYYVEISDGTRYPANSFETVSLTEWTVLDTEFMDEEFAGHIEDAAPYASIQSVFEESIEGKLDFKEKLDGNKLYLMNGIVYNQNEAGNFMWAYFLKVHGYIDLFQGILAQGGSIVQKDINKMRFDEPYDRAARYAGLKYWYQQRKQGWLFRLKYGTLDRP